MDAVLDLKLPPRQKLDKKRVEKGGRLNVRISQDGHVILKENHDDD